MNKKIFGLILCLMCSMQSPALFQNFLSTYDFMKKSVVSMPTVFILYITKISDISISNKPNVFLAQPMSSKIEDTQIATKATRSEVVDLAKNRTQKEYKYKNQHNPALHELLAYDAKYGHKPYWSDINNTGQIDLYNYASKATTLNHQVTIDFSKVDFSACSKGPKVEKFKDQSKAAFVFPQIEKFAVKPVFNPEKTFDASVYTDESRPCAQAERYL